MTTHDLFATAARGLERVVQSELRSLGAEVGRTVAGGVPFVGDLELAYRACLWSRVASRVLLRLARFPAADAEALYDAARALPWEEHVAVDGTIAVDGATRKSAIDHGHFAALKVKDAIVDRFRDRLGRRPSVDTVAPDLRLNLHIDSDVATLSIDLSGDALHRRGYRREWGAAPIKETLAAGILLLLDWPQAASRGEPFVDPMCGSGTFLVEASLLATDAAPGLLGHRFGFEHWLGHDVVAWQRLREEANQRRLAGHERLPRVVGYDSDGQAVRAALANLQAAGFGGRVHVERKAVHDCVPPPRVPPGLVVTNPPYGERIGSRTGAEDVAAALGTMLRRTFAGWRAAVLTAGPAQLRAIGLPFDRRFELWNGPIECRLVEGTVPSPPSSVVAREPSAEARSFGDRIEKNLRRLKRWIAKENIDCYRIYDADIPQYALAVDRYADWLHVQEYAPPRTVDPERARARMAEVLELLPGLVGVERERIVVKVRRKHRRGEQYGRFGDEGRFVVVREGGHAFLVNLHDRLDTGLFLDHRPTRARVGELSVGRRLLNLFCYTATATVYAAKAGARASTSVDLSQTNLAWARRNFELNQIAGARHELLQADCLTWLDRAWAAGERFGLVFLDPPTFSASKRMATTFDVERDHVMLIRKAAALLERDGVLLFSTNRRKFQLAERELGEWVITDWTAATTPPDFRLGPRPPPHRCWKLERKKA